MFRRHNKHSQVPTVALFSFGEMKAISAYYINSLSLANILWVGLVLMFPSVIAQYEHNAFETFLQREKEFA